MKRLDTTLNRVHLRRFACVAIILVSVLATIFLLRAQSQREAGAHETVIRIGWQTEALPVNGSMTAAAVRARFNITGGGAAGALTWQVVSTNELLASLWALEQASVSLREVKIARRGAGFTVSAEDIQ